MKRSDEGKTTKREETRRIQELEAELAEARNRLRAFQERNEVAREERRAADEIASSNEELGLSAEEANRARAYAEATVRTTRAPLLILRPDLRVNTANDAFYRTFKVAPAETEGQLLWELGNGQWRIPRLRELLEDILPRESSFDAFEVVHDFPNLGRRTMLLNARQLNTVEGAPEMILLAIEDVTERLRLEHSLRQARDFQNLMVESVRDHCIFTTDLEGRVSTWNKGAERMFGYTDAEIIGRPLSLVFTPEDRAAGVPEKEMELAAKSGHAGDDRWHLSKDGSRLFLSGETSPIRDEAGQLIGFAKIARNITERKQASRALSESEERYCTLFNSIDEGFCVIDVIFDPDGRPVDYRFVEVNPAFEAQSGLHGVTGRRVRELVPDHEEHWFEIYGRVARTGEATRFANEAKALDRWFDVYAFRLGNPDSPKVAVLFTDVTGRKHEEEIAARLAAVVESSEDAIITKDLNGLITSWNAAAQRLFGYTEEEAIGRPVTILIPEGHHDEEPRIMGRIRRGERVEPYETVRHRKDGTLVDVSLGVSPLKNAAGEVIGASKIARDITELRRNARELERVRDEAVAASRAKDEFLAALSHELRTPLNPALLLASDSAANGNLPDHVRADFEMIRKNISLEARLIDDLLDLTRISRGKLSIEPQLCDVHALLREAIAVVRSDLEEKHIRLSLDLGAKRVGIMGDPVRLQQVFWNVLRNAVHFTPDKGGIRVESEQTPDGGALIVRITDSGIGIAPADLERIFETFEQAEAAPGVARRFGGLGLGLPISKTMLELHGGSIHASSSGRGQGSSFIITLPVAAESEPHLNGRTFPAMAAPIEANASRPDLRDSSESRPGILVVEDHGPTRIMLARLLEQRGHEVLAAGSMAEAVAAADQHPIGLLISDIGLPDGDGYSLMRRLRSKFPGLRGIALSGYGAESDINESRDAGFVEHLIKPISIDVLNRVLDEWI